MELSQLEALVATVREGGVIRAAEALHLAQSSVTARIQALEKALGVPLFTREGRHLRLTKYGECLLPFAERAVSLLEEARRTIDAMHRAELSKVTVGLASSAPYLFREIYRNFTNLMPQVELHVRTGHSGYIHQLLLDGLVHAAVLRPIDLAPGLEVQPLYTEETVIVGSPHRSWPETLDPTGLKGERLVVFDPGSSHDRAVRQWLEQHELHLPEALFTDDVEVVKEAVSLGVGIAFLSRLVVAEDLARERLIQLPIRTGLARSTVLAFREDRLPRPVMRNLMRAIQAAVPEWARPE
jgi:DNA-binding transcriptional LysR family regulator